MNHNDLIQKIITIIETPHISKTTHVVISHDAYYVLQKKGIQSVRKHTIIGSFGLTDNEIYVAFLPVKNPKPQHGKINTYKKYKCRCELCVEAYKARVKSDYLKSERKRKLTVLKPRGKYKPRKKKTPLE